MAYGNSSTRKNFVVDRPPVRERPITERPPASLSAAMNAAWEIHADNIPARGCATAHQTANVPSFAVPISTTTRDLLS